MPGYTVWINLERDIAFQLAFYSFHINPSRLDGDEEKINIYVRKMGGCVVGSHEPGCLHVVANMLPDQVSCSSSWHTHRPPSSSWKGLEQKYVGGGIYIIIIVGTTTTIIISLME